MHFETAYLFRHALLRDAAYQLQLPGDRARLHALAFAVLEDACGGAPPPSARFDEPDPPPFQPHATDAFAAELADHARAARLEANRPTWLHYLRRAFEVADRQFRHEAAQELAMLLSEGLDGVERGVVLRWAAESARMRGRSREAEVLLTEAREISREAGNLRHEAKALEQLGVVLRTTGREEASGQAMARAGELYREAGDVRGEAFAREGLAHYHRHCGRLAEAEAGFREAQEVFRGLGRLRDEASSLLGLAMVYFESGRPGEAEKHYLAADRAQRESGSQQASGTLLVNLSNVYRETGRIELALQTLEQAIAHLRRVGNRRYEGVALATLAHHLHTADRLEPAERAYVEAIAIHRETGDLVWLTLSLGNLACLRRQTDRFDLAERGFLESLALSNSIDGGGTAGTYSCELALLRLSQGRVEEARRLWHAGMEILAKQNNPIEAEHKRSSMRDACAKAGVPAFDGRAD